MGNVSPERARELEKIWAQERRAKKKAAEVKRASIAEKVVMVIVDRIVADIVRPGPKPEERECYVMAQEMRDIGPELQDLVVQVLKVDEAERRRAGRPRTGEGVRRERGNGNG